MRENLWHYTDIRNQSKSYRYKIKIIHPLLPLYSWIIAVIPGLFPSQDVTEEDIESELAVIHSQMAYVMQLQGRTDEALQLYNQVIKLK